MLKKASEAGEPRLMDRSIYGDMIFAKLLYGEAYMEQKKKLIIKNVGTCIFGRLLNNSSVIQTLEIAIVANKVMMAEQNTE